MAHLRETVAGTLNDDQKKLVEKIQAAAVEAQREAQEQLQPTFAAAKGDPEKMKDLHDQMKNAFAQLMAKKLDALLNPQQKAAMQEAAAAQIAAEAEGGKGKGKI